MVAHVHQLHDKARLLKEVMRPCGVLHELADALHKLAGALHELDSVLHELASVGAQPCRLSGRAGSRVGPSCMGSHIIPILDRVRRS
jgi:hypothetical protein